MKINEKGNWFLLRFSFIKSDTCSLKLNLRTYLELLEYQNLTLSHKGYLFCWRVPLICTLSLPVKNVLRLNFLKKLPYKTKYKCTCELLCYHYYYFVLGLGLKAGSSMVLLPGGNYLCDLILLGCWIFYGWKRKDCRHFWLGPGW